MPPRSRRPDPEQLRAALQAQRRVLAAAGAEGGDAGDVVSAVAAGLDRHPPVPPDEGALRLAVRLLLDALTRRAPGRSVEVRVPPYAAVQCVPGPRHTRGTPPGVVETDPATWVLLATGRLGWVEALATGRVAASGERTDLSPWLPL